MFIPTNILIFLIFLGCVFAYAIFRAIKTSKAPLHINFLNAFYTEVAEHALLLVTLKHNTPPYDEQRRDNIFPVENDRFLVHRLRDLDNESAAFSSKYFGVYDKKYDIHLLLQEELFSGSIAGVTTYVYLSNESYRLPTDKMSAVGSIRERLT